MKIRSKINGLLFMAALILPPSAGVALYLTRDVAERIDDIVAAEHLIDSATQLAQVAVETALFHEVRSQDQWHRKIASINDELASIRVTSVEDKENVERIQEKIGLMQVIYPRLVREPGASTGAMGEPLSEVRATMESRSVASLLVVSQEIMVIGAELIRGNRAEAEAALRHLRLAIGLILLVIAALSAFTWKLVSRSVLRPLQDFEKGTREVAAGHYAHRLNLAQHDEIGELAAAFDAMAERVENSAAELEQHRAHLAALVLSRTTELSTARDVAERLSHYARSLIEANLDPLLTINAQGKITDVNDASVQAIGVAREQLIGTDFSDHFTEPERARSGYQRVFSEGLVRDYPLSIRDPAGRIMAVLFNAAVYRDGKGAALGVVASARDITERERLDRVLLDSNAQLQRARALADKANLAKSDFLSSMSHELRTPLNAILGFAQLIESGLPPPTPGQMKSLHQILRGGWYLLELINEILDLAQIESGRTLLSLESVEVAGVLQECRDLIEPQARNRGILLSFEGPETPWHVHADRTRMKQTVINLLSNAVKYNRPGGKVTVACSRVAPNSVRISVRDSGLGLTADQMAHLFQPFHRLGQEAGTEEGTGIGLVVTKRLVEMMGGTIGVESEVGAGSVFWIEFTATDTPQRPASAAAQAVLAPAPVPGDTPHRTVLYVEDNPANLELVEQIIARLPAVRVLSAPDGNFGIELARNCQPDVILMDINLPGISGIEAMKILRAGPSTAHIPIIALSANAMPDDIRGGLSAGFFDYLTKPIKVDAFVAALDAALQQAQGGSASNAQGTSARDGRPVAQAPTTGRT